MAFSVFNLVWERYPEGGSKLLCMLALADYCGRDDGTRLYPSAPAIAAKLRMSERQTIRIKTALIEDGYLIELTPENGGGRGVVNHYKIDVKRLTDCPKVLFRNHDSLSNKDDKLNLNPDTVSSESKPASQNAGERLNPFIKKAAALWITPNGRHRPSRVLTPWLIG